MYYHIQAVLGSNVTLVIYVMLLPREIIVFLNIFGILSTALYFPHVLAFYFLLIHNIYIIWGVINLLFIYFSWLN